MKYVVAAFLLMQALLQPPIVSDASPQYGRDRPSIGANIALQVDFVNTDLRDVLEAFSEGTGLSIAIVLGVELDRRVTLQMENVEWEEALTALLAEVDLDWERQGDYIIIRELKAHDE